MVHCLYLRRNDSNLVAPRWDRKRQSLTQNFRRRPPYRCQAHHFAATSEEHFSTPVMQTRISAEAISGNTGVEPRIRSSLNTLTGAGWRRLVAVGSVASVAVPLVWSGATTPAIDADLVRLLRMMAVLKGVIALVSVGVVWWRFSLPVLPRTAVAYLIGAWLMAGASVVMWQLTYLMAGAVVFHMGLALGLLTAWRDMPKILGARQ